MSDDDKPTDKEAQVIRTYLHPSRALSDKSAEAIESVLRAARDELIARGRPGSEGER